MIAGLVLAAGAGTRFGRPKALLEINGERFVDRAVRVLREGGADPVFVVVGAADVEGVDAIAVRCTEWSEGIGASVRCGITGIRSYARRACGESIDGVIITLVDQPGIAAAAVRRVLTSAAQGVIIAAASYDGVRGHPVYLAAPTWDEVSDLAVGDRGAGPFMASRPDLVTYVDCSGLGDSDDVDTPADLQHRGGP